MRDRLRQFLHDQHITPNRAEEICGFPRGTLQKYLSGTNIGSDKIEVISISFPSLNVHWWFTGLGEMYAFTPKKEFERTSILNDPTNSDPIDAMTKWMAKVERDLYLVKSQLKLLEKS